MSFCWCRFQSRIAHWSYRNEPEPRNPNLQSEQARCSARDCSTTRSLQDYSFRVNHVLSVAELHRACKCWLGLLIHPSNSSHLSRFTKMILSLAQWSFLQLTPVNHELVVVALFILHVHIYICNINTRFPDKLQQIRFVWLTFWERHKRY